ncbi:MAG: M48 family metallopeptidase [Rhodobiaceae bacterium]|nr:M48 family metallopeptidase [Rhodobiaceae bacterium]MCC0056117.1 M48 family metallopeptidase [Rhodobiaceae bacterium]
MADMKISGRLFAPGEAKAESAELIALQGGHVTIEDASGVARSLGLSSVSDRLGRVHRKLYLSDGSVFETDDNDGIDRLLGRETHFFSRLSRIEGSGRAVAILTVVTIAVIVGIYRYGLPAAAAVAAWATPPSVTAVMDTGTLSTLDRTLFSPSDLPEKRREDLARQFAELAALSNISDATPHLIFRRSKVIGPNAFALPGGTVVMTDELVKRAHDDDEVLGVLAHELAHVEKRHGLRNLYRVLGVGFMIAAVGGDSGQIVEDVATQGAALGNLSHSRHFEEEADMRGAELMLAAGRDPFAFIDLIGRITKDEGKSGDSWLSTHPGTQSRRGAVAAHIESLKPR